MNAETNQQNPCSLLPWAVFAVSLGLNLGQMSLYWHGKVPSRDTGDTPVVVQSSTVSVGGTSCQVTSISSEGDRDGVKTVFRDGGVRVFEGSRLIFETQTGRDSNGGSQGAAE